MIPYAIQVCKGESPLIVWFGSFFESISHCTPRSSKSLISDIALKRGMRKRLEVLVAQLVSLLQTEFRTS